MAYSLEMTWCWATIRSRNVGDSTTRALRSAPSLPYPRTSGAAHLKKQLYDRLQLADVFTQGSVPQNIACTTYQGGPCRILHTTNGR